MQKFTIYMAVLSLFLVGCAPQPEVVLEPIAVETKPEAPAVVQKPQEVVEHNANKPTLVPDLRAYYAAAAEVLGGKDRKEFDKIGKKLTDQIEGKKADVNNPDQAGVLPLLVAVEANDYEMVSRLISAGANPNALTSKNLPLITIALQEGMLESAKALIAGGASVNVGDDVAPSPLTITTLGGITSKPYQEMSMTLLANGANPNFGAIGEHSLLLYAIKTSQDNLATELVKRGADIELSDENGLTPLSWAILLNLPKTTDALIGKNANGDARDAYGYSPIAWSVFVGNESATNALVEKGFEVKENDRGWIAAEIAKTRTLNELRALLGGGVVASTVATRSDEASSIIRFKDMSFIEIRYSKNELFFKTTDPLIKELILARPDRLVVDFKRTAGVKNITLPVKSDVVKKATIGRHIGWYRVVIELDRAYKIESTTTADGVLIKLK